MYEPDFDDKKMKYFDTNHEGIIVEDLARGMSMNEACEWFGCTFEVLDEEDRKFFLYHYRRGRATGRRSAVQALFGQMTQRNGHQAALSYLTRFADEWPEEGVSAGDGFNFKVIMDKK